MMKNKKRPIFLLVSLLMLISLVTLTGCQLAIPVSNTKASTDKLCGVFVTIGYHEFPIDEEKLNETDFSVNNKGEIVFDSDAFSSLSEHRVDGTLTAEKDNILFDGFEGYYMGILEDNTEYGEPSHGLICSPDLTDAKFAVNVTDTREENSCETTLYVGKKFNELCYLNPVYLTSDGKYYAVMGNSQCTSFSGSTTGSVYSLTIDSELTKTKNDSTQAEKDSFKINIAVVDEVQKVTIKEMDQNDVLVKTTEVFSDSPEEFIVSRDTSYIIVEELYNSESESNSIKRSIYTPLPRDSYEASNQHFCNFLGEKDIITRKLIKFISE